LLVSNDSMATASGGSQWQSVHLSLVCHRPRRLLPLLQWLWWKPETLYCVMELEAGREGQDDPGHSIHPDPTQYAHSSIFLSLLTTHIGNTSSHSLTN